MDKNNQLLSNARINRIRAQGYFAYSDEEISEIPFGNRFAYITCGSIVAVGVLTANIPILAAITLVAFFGVILPNHPFDYIYNNVVRHMLQKPELPPRAIQLRFACTIATLWLISTTTLFYTGNTTAGYVVGGLLLVTTDLCIPSMIFNYLFKDEV